MKRTAFLILLIGLSGLLFAQDNAGKKKKGKDKKEKKEKVEKVDLSEKEQKRPVAPWVFEGGLDEKPGRVVTALNKNLWIAYDTTTCAPFRIWRGSAFVNTNSVNRDMIIEGFYFVENPGTQQVWRVKKGNTTLGSKVSFEKHEVIDDKAYLTYNFTLDNGQKFQVKENPEYELQKRPNANRITLIRSYTVENAPPGVSILLDFDISNVPKMGDIKSSSKIVGLKKSKRMYDWGDMFSAKGSLLLSNTKVSTFTTTFTMDGESYYSSRPTSN